MPIWYKCCKVVNLVGKDLTILILIFFSCGGSIIDKNWILSAGHCCAAIKRRNNNGVVVLGSIDLRSRDGIDQFR